MSKLFHRVLIRLLTETSVDNARRPSLDRRAVGWLLVLAAVTMLLERPDTRFLEICLIFVALGFATGLGNALGRRLCMVSKPAFDEPKEPVPPTVRTPPEVDEDDEDILVIQFMEPLQETKRK